jgi:flagellar protein FlaG
MKIEPLIQGSSPSRIASQNAPPVAAQTETAQLRESEAKEAKSGSLAVDDQNETAKSTLSIEDAVKRISDFVAPNQSALSFSIDNASGSQVVTITDSQSNEVIRQFPSKEAIAIALALDKLQGLLIKDKA